MTANGHGYSKNKDAVLKRADVLQFSALKTFEPDYENIHHRNETLFGPGDPWLLGRATGMLGRLRITSREAWTFHR